MESSKPAKDSSCFLRAQGAIEKPPASAHPLLAQGAIEPRKAATAHPLLAQGAIEPNCGSAAHPLLAQGATEYLVIFAAALIIALLVFTYLRSSASNSAAIGETESSVYWSNSARPIQILAASTVFGNPCGTSGSGAYELSARNADPSSITLDSVTVNGQSVPFCERGGTVSSRVSIPAHGNSVLVLVAAPGAKVCADGKLVFPRFVFNYTSNSLAHSQTGAHELYVTCTNAAPSS